MEISYLASEATGQLVFTNSSLLREMRWLVRFIQLQPVYISSSSLGTAYITIQKSCLFLLRDVIVFSSSGNLKRSVFSSLYHLMPAD